MPIGDSGRVRLGERKKGTQRDVDTMGLRIPPYRKRHGNDFISARAGDRAWRKKIGRQRATEAGSKKLVPRGEREGELSRGAIGKWTRNDHKGKYEKIYNSYI